MWPVAAILAALMPRKLVSIPEVSVTQDCARALGNPSVRASRANNKQAVRLRIEGL
jgi:hypothetical protein